MFGDTLLIGGTGAVGREVLRAMQRRGAMGKVLVRDVMKAASKTPGGFQLVQGSLEDTGSLERAMAGAKKLFLLTPPDERQMEWQSNAIVAAKRAGVEYVCKLSVIGADVNSPIHLGRWHGLSELELEESGLRYTHLRPTSFMQNLLMQAPVMQARGEFYGCAGRGKVSLIDCYDIGEVAAECLSKPGHAGKTYTLTGPEALEHAQVAELLSNLTGRMIRYVDLPAEAYQEGLEATGVPTWLAEDLTFLGAKVMATGAAEWVSPDVEKVTGRAGRTFAEFAEENAGAWG